jgi:beta-glucanase (GH16 family)
VLDQTALTLRAGSEAALTLSEQPEEAELTWTSSDQAVATVKDGLVKAFKAGESDLTVSAGGLSATCKLTVTERGEYQLVWADEFSGDVLDGNVWSIEVSGGGGGNGELQYFTDRSENVRLENGLLILEARKERYGLYHDYTSGRINSKDKKHFTYGKIEASMQIPAGRGTWPAFWMLGYESIYGTWPFCGEIDIMEHVGFRPDTVFHTLHSNGNSGGAGKQTNTAVPGATSGFHIYALEWVQNEDKNGDIIRFLVDGNVKTWHREVSFKQWPFDQPFYFIFNLAIGGIWGGAEKDPDGDGIEDNGVDDSIFNNPVQMKVDWVRVYQYQ